MPYKSQNSPNFFQKFNEPEPAKLTELENVRISIYNV